MSGGGNKVKDQTYSTGGLYGSSTTGKRGTTYKPSDFESQLVQQTTSAIPDYLSQLINPTYDSQAYLNRQQQLNNTARQSLENNVINPLAQRGLIIRTVWFMKRRKGSSLAKGLRGKAFRRRLGCFMLP